MRFQGYTSEHDHDGVLHVESSQFVDIDRGNPCLYLDCSVEPSLTRQEFAAECDINTIMAQYEKTGVINHYARTEPQYLDVTNVPDLQAALNILDEAGRAFMSLPAVVRREFDNDVAKFVSFAQDPANVDKMREWGLAEPLPPEPTPLKVEVINPSPEPPQAK